MSFNSETYFCMELTEDEHFIIEAMLREFCNQNDMKLVYYRKIKTGHIPSIREVKVQYNRKNRGLFIKFMNEQITWNSARRWEDGKLVAYGFPTAIKAEVAV